MEIPSNLAKKIVKQENIAEFLRTHTIRPLVFTNGCFDIVHPGHITYLLKARELGNFLWVGLNSDSSVKKLKGTNRPVNNETHRAIVLSSLFFVDAVTIFSEDTPIELIQDIKPNIHVKGGDYKKESLVEYDAVLENGGRVEILPFIDGESTSAIIQKIKKIS